MSHVDRTELIRRAVRWRAADPDPTTRAAIDDVVERSDPTELQDLFGHALEFGTAGLRGPLGPGPNRMNRLVVRRLATALADHLHGAVGAGRRPRVVIGRDARHGSAAFGEDLIEVLSGAGVDVEHFDEPVPTPLVAFAVRSRRADGGIVVTASHNPAADNGLKVYGGDGAQIVPPTDEQIARRLRALPLGPATGPTANPGAVAALAGPSSAARTRTVGADVVSEYLTRAASLVPDRVASPLRVAHTSLHGVGDVLLARALMLLEGVEAHAVTDQQRPDPDFPGLAGPNPEELGSLDAVLELARGIDADVALALDPDADRLAVALPDADRRWRPLRGDELGALLAARLLATTQGADRLIATTLVSSRLVPAMCHDAGVHHAETLTGFKWLCRPGIAHPEWHQLLLYEEALGYAVGPDARDKDGITAALATLEAVASWRHAGRTAWDVLDDLARRHGAHVTHNGFVRTTSTGRTVSLEEALARLGRPSATLGGVAVVRTDRPAPDVVRWWLADDTRVVVRPSGTEPKVKYYVEAVEPVEPLGVVSGGDDVSADAARAVAAERAEVVVDDLVRLISR